MGKKRSMISLEKALKSDRMMRALTGLDGPAFLRLEKRFAGVLAQAAARAERMLAEELKQRGWSSGQLAGRRKGDLEKVKIARRLRKETTMTLDWIAQRLNMGAAGYAAQCLRQTR